MGCLEKDFNKGQVASFRCYNSCHFPMPETRVDLMHNYPGQIVCERVSRARFGCIKLAHAFERQTPISTTPNNDLEPRVRVHFFSQPLTV